jgi:hypothetical protein
MFSSPLFGPAYYKPLSAVEAEKLQTLKNQIASTDTNAIEAAILDIRELSQEDVVRFTKASPELFMFCVTNAPLQTTWQATLTTYYPNTQAQALISLHGKTEAHPVFHHYVSAYLLNSYIGYAHTESTDNTGNHQKPKANITNLLNEACKLGSYYALARRSKQNRDALFMEEKVSPELIKEDANRLADLYGELGYLKAGLAWIDLSNYYREKIQDIELADDYFEHAIRHFLCATLLGSQAYSHQLTETLTKGLGLASTFATDNEGEDLKKIFATPLQIQSQLQALINNDDIFKILLGQAKTEIAGLKYSSNPKL